MLEFKRKDKLELDPWQVSPRIYRSEKYYPVCNDYKIRINGRVYEEYNDEMIAALVKEYCWAQLNGTAMTYVIST